ncbi:MULTISPECIES: hypothetical protein [Celeribacter]|jgi:hypothetical protein|uniref:Uncharacterized protein n=1 Tax=Celeribacter halophilus TaxID=576117 RepID=A0A1I3QWI9_9RHOB|nr:hypothetical protein [Celeribacter halophilus]MDO6456085.1 hypothetical protein [Celeribacter halophilus]PZX13292.1 hypothetical protein LX82_01128 [Celeribacter halophilus]SFJ37487.1 hypothetical protein SAMN04488138_104111 [Celeribacter halophilus]
MTRRFTATLAIVGLFLLVGFDLMSAPPNPYHAPPALALGSGIAASGGFCGALPD